VTTVVVVTGPPAAGKSTFAERLRELLRIPLVAKDTFKEALFDHLGSSDRNRSKELGAASFEIQYLVARELLRTDTKFILETAFHKHSLEGLKALLSGHEIIQIWLSADLDTLVERAKSRPRHAGHGGWSAAIEEEMREKVAEGLYAPLDIGGELLEIDTNCFGTRYQEALNNVVARVA
jgi:predicted kinase